MTPRRRYSTVKKFVAKTLGRGAHRLDDFKNERAGMTRLAARFVRASSLEGDYLEFGVYRGDTFVDAYQSAVSLGLESMRFHAFDSFEGLPNPGGVDSEGFAHFAKGEYSASRTLFNQTLRKGGVDAARVTVTEGWFSDTLTEETRSQLKLEKAVVIWVDCDLYESTVPVLEFIRPLLQDGTVLIFDDWFCFRARADRGEQLAVAEWLAAEPALTLVDYCNIGWHGKAFIVNV